MTDALRASWDELVDHVVAAYRACAKSVFLNFYHDFADRTMRLRVSGQEPDWVIRHVSDDELRSADLRCIAAQVFAEANAPDGPAGEGDTSA